MRLTSVCENKSSSPRILYKSPEARNIGQSRTRLLLMTLCEPLIWNMVLIVIWTRQH